MTTALEKVESYLSRHRADYLALVREVRDACATVKNAASGRVYRVYSRGEKQPGGEELKDAAKVLEKLETPTPSALKKLHDIIGVTIVIHYPDDAIDICNRVAEVLSRRSIRMTWGPKTYTDGYYATHAAFTSSRSDHSGLLCELQIKTVLHDAWSAKMHDLTYKPAGAMDGRLNGLMSAVSSQIEGIERQSLTIRNIIQGRQRLESRAFQRYCDGLFAYMAPTDLMTDANAKALQSRIEAVRTAAHAGQPDLGEAQAIIDEIARTEDDGPLARVGWLLVGQLASGFVFGDRGRDLATQTERLLDYAEAHPEDEELFDDLLMQVPAMFYVAGDLTRAAEFTERLGTGLLKDRLDPAKSASFEFNRLTYLLEWEHLKPTRSKAYRASLKADVSAVLERPELLARADMASAILDTKGLFSIVFGETAADVRQGIRLCTESAALAEGEDRQVAEACLEWRLEAGWRRYFDLSDR